MVVAKFSIKKKCPICGKTFMAKRLDSVYCSPPCSKKAWSIKRRAELEQEKLKKFAERVPDTRDFISVAEASAIYGVERKTIHRLIQKGVLNSFNPGKRLTRVSRKDIEKMYPKRTNPIKEDNPNDPQWFDMNPRHCYTISEISKKFDIDDSSVWSHIRKYSIPTRQIGNYVYAPKSEIDKLYSSL
jgi:excisionase family DNA binding protein